jgi:hypothetical protein
MSHRGLLVFVACLPGLAACAEEGPPTGERTAVTVALGMPYEAAVTAIKEAGGWEFPCGYRFLFRAGSTAPRPVYGWYTLPNGMSLSLFAEGEGGGKGHPITRLDICDSTALFCCKGEQWFALERIELTGRRAVLQGLAAVAHRRGESRSRTHAGVRYTAAEKQADAIFLHKGMTEAGARAAIKKAGVRSLAMDEPLRTRLPDRGVWSRYALPGKTQLLMNVQASQDAERKLVSVLVVEAPGDELDVKRRTRHWLDFEVVDLRVPIRPDWHVSFWDRFLWRPGGRDRLEQAKRAGQRR